jgi:hypothetical protein
MIRPGARCQYPVQQADSVLRWPPGEIVTWCLAATSPLPPGWTHEKTEAILGAGIAVWPACCAVDVEPTTDEQTACVVAVFVALDPSGIELGLTDLPSGQPQSLLRLNLDDQWTEEELAQVAMHEFGHALGLVHCNSTVHAVMNPIYQADLLGPQSWDIAQAKLRYPDRGPPILPAPTPTPPDSAARPQVTLHVLQPGSIALSLDFEEAGDYLVTVQRIK